MAGLESKGLDVAFPIWKVAGMESILKQHRLLRKMQLKDAACEIGVAPSVLNKWEKGKVPAHRVLEVERVTGVSRHALRPDVFGPFPASQREQVA